MDCPEGATSIRFTHDSLPLLLHRSSTPWQEWSCHSQASCRPVGAYGVASACPSVVAGWTLSVSRCFSPASLLRSHSTLHPFADVIATEARVKLMADIAFSFDGLFASDIHGPARPFKSLAGVGISAEEAARVTGLS